MEIPSRLRHDAALRKPRGNDRMSDLLQIEDFKPHVGKLVRFKGTHFVFPLNRIISDRKRLPKGVKRRPFILIFRGPKERDYLPDGIYECEIRSEEHTSELQSPD